VFVTNHSHDDTGDLYISPDFSATVGDVCQLIVSPFTHTDFGLFCTVHDCNISGDHRFFLQGEIH
jgi:hypothetical protein